MCHTQSQGLSRFRGDIEGLRALAVLIVVLFHLQVPGLHGGYVGVDVFFVISGFVVTRSLLPRLKSRGYSLREFYFARFWRLQPSFFLVATVTMLVAPFILGSSDLIALGRSAVAAAFMMANLFFWKNTSGYEAADAEESPLLHMWSLAVEEQFYLLWPWLLLIGLRFKSLHRPVSLGVILTTLVVLSEALAQWYSSFAYFMLPSRMFELALGGVLVGLEHWKLKRWQAELSWLIGIVLILGSATFLTKHSSFPGINALLPSLGTALIIQAGTRARKSSQLLTLPLIRYLGRISYVWYLWHWVPIAFLNYEQVTFTPRVQVLTFSGPLLLAIVSHHLWEKPTRRRPGRVWKVGVAIVLLLGAVATSRAIRTEPSLTVATPQPDARVDFKGLDCIVHAGSLEALDECQDVNTPQRKRILVWGDSHARAYRDLLKRNLQLGWTPTPVIVSGCPPLYGVHRTDSGDTTKFCQGQVASHVEQLLARFKFDAILLVSRYPIYENGYFKRGTLQKTTHFLSDSRIDSKSPQQSAAVFRRAFRQTLDHLVKDLRIPVILALPTPIMPMKSAKDRTRSMSVSMDEYLSYRRSITQLVREYRHGLIVLDPKDQLCGLHSCPGWIDGKAVYRDDNHFTKMGANLLLPALTEALSRL